MTLDFQQDVSELAVKRHSVRTYLPQKLNQAELKACMAPLTNETALFGAATRYELVRTDHTPVKLGTYGMIHGAKTFIAAVTSKENLRAGFLQIGYQLEQTVLLAADRGLGTCWLGGTFDSTAFWQAAGVGQNEQLVIVLPIGYPSEKKRLVERVMRGMAGSGSRRAFEKLFFHAQDGTPLSEQASGAFSVPLSCVRLAPSAVNRQPWRVYLSQEMACFYMDQGRHAEQSSAKTTIAYVDMGIAMCHFEAGAMQAGLKGNWLFEDPQLNVPASYEFIGSWKLNQKE